ncbi:DNA gyrase subunit A, partial [Anaerostipes sp.]|uniref:DNA gyrase subunit A n=1 Tax=Anaerostipes sp. TaxID=1872530 RepID=UPI0025866CED
MSEHIIKAEFSEVMQKSYIDYAMSVICARALPDARDGLKPVQRRVLYSMDELGLRYDRPHRKSARIVGDTMGKYHPHGDSSIYESLVVMSQDFKKGVPLVDGHGNFGSIEGDGAAAMRYTEARLQKITQEAYLADLDKNVVDFVSNFDETEKEPEVLPVKVPNLLVNGADGIAVGMTTSIPPHNLGEVVDAVKAYMRKESITNEELMEYIEGPDFPTGGLVINKKDLLNIYSSGTGKLKLRGKVTFEPAKKRGEKDKLVISEIPYTMIGNNISKFLSDTVALIENKVTTDILDISNESSKDGIRIVLELRKGADVERLKNLLYKKTKLEDTFGVNMLAIVDGRPETLDLKGIIENHMQFYYEVTRRKYKTLLSKLYEQREIKEGLIKACDMIDLIIDVEKGISFSNLTDQEAVDVDGNVAKDVNGMEVTNASVSELRLINNDNSYMIRWQGGAGADYADANQVYLYEVTNTKDGEGKVVVGDFDAAKPALMAEHVSSFSVDLSELDKRKVVLNMIFTYQDKSYDISETIKLRNDLSSEPSSIYSWISGIRIIPEHADLKQGQAFVFDYEITGDEEAIAQGVTWAVSYQDGSACK